MKAILLLQLRAVLEDIQNLFHSSLRDRCLYNPPYALRPNEVAIIWVALKIMGPLGYRLYSDTSCFRGAKMES